MSARRFGTFNPWLSASTMASGLRPSIEIITTIGLLPRPAGNAEAETNRALSSARIVRSRRIKSEARRPLIDHIERALERQTHTRQGALVEQAADEGHAVRHASRRVEFHRRMFGIGRPVAARFGDFDEARAQRQRRYPDEVADGQHVIA